MTVYAFNAGHGLGTAGKRSPDDEREWSFNNIICTAAIDEINKYQGVTVVRADDPTGKIDVPLGERINKALRAKAKRYISFHNNALAGKWGTHGGTETLIHPQTSADNKALAQKIQKIQVDVTGLRDRGIKTRTNLYEVNAKGISTILTETAFMDSTTDIGVLRDRQKLEDVGRAIARTIAEHDGLKLKAGVTSAKPKEEKPVTQKDDIKGHWAEEHVEKMIKTGAMTRDKNGQFNPNEPLTRAQLCAILDRLKLI